MQISKEIDNLIKGFVAGEMTSTDDTAECFDSVVNGKVKTIARVDGIKWDADNAEDVAHLPSEMDLEIPEHVDVDDEDELEEFISEELSNQSGFSHDGWADYEIISDEKPTPWEPFEHWPNEDFAGAMQNMHSSATRLIQSAIAAMTVDELLEEIRSRKERAIIVWSPEDVYGIAKDMGETITEEEALNILGLIEYKHDAEYGVTWETIRFHVQRTVEERRG